MRRAKAAPRKGSGTAYGGSPRIDDLWRVNAPLPFVLYYTILLYSILYHYYYYYYYYYPLRFPFSGPVRSWLRPPRVREAYIYIYIYIYISEGPLHICMKRGYLNKPLAGSKILKQQLSWTFNHHLRISDAIWGFWTQLEDFRHNLRILDAIWVMKGFQTTSTEYLSFLM